MAAAGSGDGVDAEVAAWRTAEKRAELLAACGAKLHEKLRDDGTLNRFLVARKGVVAEAAKMLMRHQQWRDEECPWWPAAHAPFASMGDAMAEKASFIRGVDKQHRPCVYIVSREHAASLDRAQLYQWITFQLDEVCARADASDENVSHQFVGIIDTGSLGWRTLDGDALKRIFLMLAANYPERLGRLYLLNDNLLFRTVWRLVQVFIDARTARKITFLGGPDTYTPALLEDFEADQLWAGVGGSQLYDYDPAHITGTPSAYITVRHGPFPPKGSHRHHHHSHGHGHGHSAAHGGAGAGVAAAAAGSGAGTAAAADGAAAAAGAVTVSTTEAAVKL